MRLSLLCFKYYKSIRDWPFTILARFFFVSVYLFYAVNTPLYTIIFFLHKKWTFKDILIDVQKIFIPTLAGLTNRPPVRDSRSGTPLL